EFSTQGGTQFSLKHLKNTVPVFIFGSPLQNTPNGIEISKFGFSLFLANPLILCMYMWFLADIKTRKINLP
ncbi:MAG: hypothetical protein Q4E07_07405, partial [Eubacteriales bacterium]|nr:hypothetical protein [Eubacteriales bacterium]